MANLRDVITNTPQAQRQSFSWYQKNIIDAAKGMSVQKFMGDNVPHQTSNIQPGQMLSFFYDPKYKDKLPYYDSFPLIFPWDVTPTHFIGINLHYISPQMRLVLLEKLMGISSSDLSATKKLSFSWQTIKNMSEVPKIQHCVKQYLFSHVKSRFLVVPPSDWKYVVLLPLSRFKKASADQVWRA